MFFSVVLSVNAQSVGKQQIIDKESLKTSSFGEMGQEWYTSKYNASNLFDNKINNRSYFSDIGRSGFDATFEPLKEPVCFAQIHVYNQQGSNYNLKISNGDKFIFYESKLNLPVETIESQDCIEGANQITGNFFAADDIYTTISEIKLFSNSTVVNPCTPGSHIDPETGECVPNGNGDINIINSTATINSNNSDIVLNLDEDSDLEVNKVDSDNDKEEEEDDEN